MSSYPLEPVAVIPIRVPSTARQLSDDEALCLCSHGIDQHGGDGRCRGALCGCTKPRPLVHAFVARGAAPAYDADICAECGHDESCTRHGGPLACQLWYTSCGPKDPRFRR